MARRRLSKPHYLVNLGLSLAVLGVFALTGVQINSQTSAATANPYGYADYCALENNTTVIYGWAADPNAGSLSGPSVTINAGGQSVTTTSNRAGYRDSFVNGWIDQNRAGDPKPGSYGFRATFGGLYKGTRNAITGTALNEGPGSSVILTINNNSYTDGDGTKPFFGNNVIPDSCLATVPAGQTPVAPQPPTPAPAATPPGSATSRANDASITAGTLAAQLSVPAGGAATVHIDYGKSPVKMDQSTADQPVTGTGTAIMLTGLDPAQAYSYQIVRTNAAGKSTTSGIGKFETLGFIVALHFVDNQNKGVQGVPATIDTQDKRKTSDDAGNMQFTAVPAGSHTVTYTYDDKHYTKSVTANPSTVSPAESSAASVVTIDYSINIEAAIQRETEAAAAKSSDTGIWIGLGVGIFVLLLILFIVIRSKKRRAADEYYYETPSLPLPDYNTTSSSPTTGPPQRAAHMGESLKEMVLRGMHDDANRNGPK